MRWATWWLLVAALVPPSLAQTNPTVCEDSACQCFSFTRVICNCTKDNVDVTLRPEGAYRVPSGTTAIVVDGCARVTFLTNTIRNLIQLRNIELRNVQQIYITKESLAWSPFSSHIEQNPGITIAIYNSTISEISSHAIQGRVDEIIIRSSRISAVKAVAFSSLTGVKRIELTDNVFDNIETQAFKKFTTSNFLLQGGTIRSLPSRFLWHVEVTNLFRMDGVRVREINSVTFLVNSPKRTLVENNNIDILRGDSFKMVTRGPVTFRNNTINAVMEGAFLGFSIDREVSSVTGLVELLIDNNTVTELTPSSLKYNTTGLALRIDGLNLNTSCSCELVEMWRERLKDGGTINCWYELENHYVSLPTYMDSRCGTFKQTFWIFIVVGVVIVMIIAAVVIFFVVRRENEKKKKIQIIMPDGKTYRETEFHIVVERADLLTTDL